MKYMMLVCVPEGVELSPQEQAEIGPATDAWVQEMEGRGIRLEGHQLRPVSDATTVQMRSGDLLVCDGPFAETKEQIAGFYLVDCQDLDEAIEVASKIPSAQWGTIEVRPIWDA